MEQTREETDHLQALMTYGLELEKANKAVAKAKRYWEKYYYHLETSQNLYDYLAVNKKGPYFLLQYHERMSNKFWEMYKREMEGVWIILLL